MNNHTPPISRLRSTAWPKNQPTLTPRGQHHVWAAKRRNLRAARARAERQGKYSRWRAYARDGAFRFRNTSSPAGCPPLKPGILPPTERAALCCPGDRPRQLPRRVLHPRRGPFEGR